MDPATPLKKGKRKITLVTQSSLSLEKKKQKTPDDLEARRLKFDEAEFAPFATYKLLNYSPKDAGKLSEDIIDIFKYICTVCQIPEDFEENHKYGPKSGISYEERLIFAYANKQFHRPHTLLRKFILSRRFHKAAALIPQLAHPNNMDTN